MSAFLTSVLILSMGDTGPIKRLDDLGSAVSTLSTHSRSTRGQPRRKSATQMQIQNDVVYMCSCVHRCILTCIYFYIYIYYTYLCECVSMKNDR